MKRTLLSTIYGRDLRLNSLTAEEQDEIPAQAHYALRDSTGKLVAIINHDDLYDENGNRFAIDIDL